MSGVFGVIDTKAGAAAARLADALGAALRHKPWIVIEQHADPAAGVALGRAGLGLFNAAPQPVWNAERSVALVMAGELYAGAGVLAAAPAAALEAYERHGPAFARQLNGAFVMALWDARRRRVVLTNDRFGLYTTYYAWRAGRLTFAPELKGLVRDPDFARRLDWIALAQYLRFQHLLGARTFFEDVHLFPAATALVCDLEAGSLRLEPYWSYADIAPRAGLSAAEAAGEGGARLRRAVERLSGDAYRPGVYLSGGLDSRTILGLVRRRPVASLTYGRRDCRDVRYAAAVARAVGSDHQWCDLPDGRWVEAWADFHLQLTGGEQSWIHAHGISSLAQARECMDVNLTGWDGGTVMGHPASVEPRQIAAVDDLALTARLFELFTGHFTWPSLTELEARQVAAAALWPQLQGAAEESFQQELRPYLGLRPDVRADFFFIDQHCRRLTQGMVTVARSHIEVRFPFFDYDLFDLIYALPAALRLERRLYRAVIERETPRLATIPYDRDELPPTTRRLPRALSGAALTLRRRFNRHIAPWFPEAATLYADYEAYLRGELRAWAEGILFDPRTLSRGLFNPAALRSLMARHLSGQEHWTIGKIAPLISYELMLRALYD